MSVLKTMKNSDRTIFSTPCPVGEGDGSHKPKRNTKERFCSGCGIPLSTYNPNKKCFACIDGGISLTIGDSD